MPRPDICLGFSASNTPEWLLRSCEQQFLQRGYSVAVDFPYSGCLVPERYAGDSRLPAIMLEINPGLYLKPAVREAYRYSNLAVRLQEFARLKNDIWAVMLGLTKELVCRCG